MGTRPKHIKRDNRFPKLIKRNHEVTSDETTWHNCIAFAYGDTSRKYWPTFHPDFYWPPSLPKTERIETFKRLFEGIGYKECTDGKLVDKIEKVAIYANSNGEPKHASLQLIDGRWASKLGDWFDIQHTETAVSDGDYGKIVTFMERPRI